MIKQRPLDRHPWQPLRYITEYGTVDTCRDYAARPKALVAVEVTGAIARMMEWGDWPDVPDGWKGED